MTTSRAPQTRRVCVQASEEVARYQRKHCSTVIAKYVYRWQSQACYCDVLSATACVAPPAPPAGAGAAFLIAIYPSIRPAISPECSAVCMPSGAVDVLEPLEFTQDAQQGRRTSEKRRVGAPYLGMCQCEKSIAETGGASVAPRHRSLQMRGVGR